MNNLLKKLINSIVKFVTTNNHVVLYVQKPRNFLNKDKKLPNRKL